MLTACAGLSRMSLPVRERGSKLGLLSQPGLLSQSLPVRERGSKHCRLCQQGQRVQVAPRAGAWIETLTGGHLNLAGGSRSPCGSVDRNSGGLDGRKAEPPSLPVRERGSKPAFRDPDGAGQPSLPVRERGSKQLVHRYLQPSRRRSPCGSVDRNTSRKVAPCLMACRSPCGSVDRNHRRRLHHLNRSGRSPCGSVDRNYERRRFWFTDQRSLPVRERGSKPAMHRP